MDKECISCSCGNDHWIISNNKITCSKCKLSKDNIFIYQDKDPAEILKEMKIPISLPNAVDLAKARLLRYKREGELLAKIEEAIKEYYIYFYKSKD